MKLPRISPYRVLLLISLCSLIGVIWIAWSLIKPSTHETGAATLDSFAWRVDNGILQFSTDVHLQVPSTLSGAARRGVPLTFRYDIVLYKRRPYGLDTQVLEQHLLFHIRYNALLRQWHVLYNGQDSLALSLQDCIDEITHLKNWPLISIKDLDVGVLYYAKVRFQLDTSFLALPFQINALNNSAWILSTPWINIPLLLVNSNVGE